MLCLCMQVVIQMSTLARACAPPQARPTSGGDDKKFKTETMQLYDEAELSLAWSARKRSFTAE